MHIILKAPMKKHLPKATSIIPLLLALGMLGVSPTIKAEEDSVADFWNETQISGKIRSYYFSRDYSKAGKINQYSYSLGGELNILTGSFWSGFRIGAAAYTAQSLGLNGDNYQRMDTTLPGNSINALGQAFLQYSRAGFLVRGGDQLINTPWLNAADSRMIPATYRGILGTWKPVENWTLTALRIYAFKGRVANDFSATNVYNPQNQGSLALTKLGDQTNRGAQAVGVNYETAALRGQIWAYQFFDFAKLFYGDLQYTFKNKTEINPFIAAQWVTETGDGDNTLEQVASGRADALGYGALTGVELPQGKITLGYNRVVAHAAAYGAGNIVSPYTYTSDPLYTTSMIAGLVDKSSGDAWKVAGTVYALEKQLQVTASFAQYFTEPYLSNTQETNLDLTYAFKKARNKALRGLSLRNRLGVMSGDPTKGTFYYNRVMLEYSF